MPPLPFSTPPPPLHHNAGRQQYQPDSVTKAQYIIFPFQPAQRNSTTSRSPSAHPPTTRCPWQRKQCTPQRSTCQERSHS
eukprot:4092291-Amphidinium_carterae.1